MPTSENAYSGAGWCFPPTTVARAISGTGAVASCRKSQQHDPVSPQQHWWAWADADSTDEDPAPDTQIGRGPARLIETCATPMTSTRSTTAIREYILRSAFNLPISSILCYQKKYSCSAASCQSN